VLAELEHQKQRRGKQALAFIATNEKSQNVEKKNIVRRVLPWGTEEKFQKGDHHRKAAMKTTHDYPKKTADSQGKLVENRVEWSQNCSQMRKTYAESVLEKGQEVGLCDLRKGKERRAQKRTRSVGEDKTDQRKPWLALRQYARLQRPENHQKR
jgi:hypothetical protein